MEASTLADRVYENLKQRILKQEFPSGERLNIAAIAKDLDVSNTPVREAVSRLEKVGLIKIVPYRGPYVRSLSESETAEVYDVRISLEALAARLATLHATPSALEEIGRRLTEFEEARRSGDFDEVLQADLHFHQSIAQASGNRTLIDMLSMLSDWTLLIMQYSLPPVRPSWVKGATHKCILQAVSSGDKEKAAATMREHLIAGKSLLLQQLKELDAPMRSDDQSTYTDVWESQPDNQ